MSRGLAFLSIAFLGAPTAFAQYTQRVSVTSSGGNLFGSSLATSMDAEGRWIAFDSSLTGSFYQVFVRDRSTGTTDLVSVDSNGIAGDDESSDARLSSDGRFVSFLSWSSHLVPRDTNGRPDAFVRDRLLGTTERVSVSTAGVEGDEASWPGPITPDGRYVMFDSWADNLTPGLVLHREQVFLRDRQRGTTERMSLAFGGGTPDADCYGDSISADGRYVGFTSGATNLLATGDGNATSDAFVFDRELGSNERVSVGSAGIEANDESGGAILSTDGRFVAFLSYATNLVPGATNGHSQIYVHDRRTGITQLVSKNSNGEEGNDDSFAPSISGNGNCVAFASVATNLVFGDTNGFTDVFVRDLGAGTIERVNIRSDGMQANAHTTWSALPMSREGHIIAFTSQATNLVPIDPNGNWDDVFVHDRFGGPEFTSVCEPGAASVVDCPCGNSARARYRGCDNSASTGGASLSASGGSFVSSDSLQLKVSGELPSSLSILLQGTTSNSSGAVYGQGVRCVRGSVRRLYSKSAESSSVLVPDFATGDAPISVRSGAMGDEIQSGEQRWYQVIYRDPIVLGGCPASSTFNATQAGVVTWAP